MKPESQPATVATSDHDLTEQPGAPAALSNAHPVPPQPETPSDAQVYAQVPLSTDAPAEEVEEGEAMDAVNDDDADVMALMGLRGFGTTKV